MRITSGSELLQRLDQTGIDGVKLEDGHLKTRNAFSGILRKIGDAFLSLSESGRAAIQQRNENLHAAMAERLRNTDLGGDNASVARDLVAHFGENKDVFTVLVRANPAAMQYVPRNIMKDVCWDLVSENPAALQYVPENRRDRDLCWMALNKSDGQGRPALDFVPMNVRNAILGSLTGNLCWVMKVPECFLRDAEFCKAAVKQNDRLRQAIMDELRSGGTGDIPAFFLWDAEFRKEAVKLDGMMLGRLHEDLQTEDLCKDAVKQNGEALRFVPKELRTKDLCKDAVKHKWQALRSVPEDLLTEDICKDAVKQHGWLLKEIPPRLQTRDVCLAAVKQDGMALQFAAKDFQMDRDVCLAAVKQDGMALQFVPGNLRTEIQEALGLGN